MALVPWPTGSDSKVAADYVLERIKPRVQVVNTLGKPDYTEPVNSNAILPLAILAAERVQEYAPNAPQAIKDEALIRYAGYLFQSGTGATRAEEKAIDGMGEAAQVIRAELTTNHAAAFTNSGAAGLLTRWKKRRGGLIG